MKRKPNDKIWIRHWLSEKRVEFHAKAEIHFDASGDIADRAFIQCDPQRLKRVISNLINNAVESGSREVRLRVQPSCRGESVEVVIADQGSGIPREVLEQLGQKRLSHGDHACIPAPAGGELVYASRFFCDEEQSRFDRR